MDRPVEEIARQADAQIQLGFTIWQKWTCQHCGSRQTMAEPNLLFRSGICQECGKQSTIEVCGFMLAGGDLVDDVAQSIRDA